MMIFKKVKRKTKNQNQVLVVDPPRLSRLYTWKARYKKSLIDPCAKVCQPVTKLSKKQFTKTVFFIPHLVHRPTAAAL